MKGQNAKDKRERTEGRKESGVEEARRKKKLTIVTVTVK